MIARRGRSRSAICWALPLRVLWRFSRALRFLLDIEDAFYNSRARLNSLVGGIFGRLRRSAVYVCQHLGRRAGVWRIISAFC
jgi:hypothetical protein